MGSGASVSPEAGRSLEDRYGVVGVGESAQACPGAQDSCSCWCACVSNGAVWCQPSGGGRKRKGSFVLAHLLSLNLASRLSLRSSPVFLSFLLPSLHFPPPFPSPMGSSFRESAFSRCLTEYTQGKQQSGQKVWGWIKQRLALRWWLLQPGQGGKLGWWRSRCGPLQLSFSLMTLLLVDFVD